jgi:hypothetical protein
MPYPMATNAVSTSGFAASQTEPWAQSLGIGVECSGQPEEAGGAAAYVLQQLIGLASSNTAIKRVSPLIVIFPLITHSICIYLANYVDPTKPIKFNKVILRTAPNNPLLGQFGGSIEAMAEVGLGSSSYLRASARRACSRFARALS